MAHPALLFYDDADHGWDAGLRQLCALQGLRCRRVEDRELSLPLAALADGLRAPADAPAAHLPEPVFVLSGGSLDRILSGLGRAGVPRSVLKAVLTPTNAGWTLPQLYRELVKERLRFL